jgi:hypothetical protein
MTNDIHMQDLVALTEDVAATHFITHQPLQLRRGQVGTVVMPLNENDFQVEFSDREGRAYAMLPLNSKQLMILREQPERRRLEITTRGIEEGDEVLIHRVLDRKEAYD